MAVLAVKLALVIIFYEIWKNLFLSNNDLFSILGKPYLFWTCFVLFEFCCHDRLNLGRRNNYLWWYIGLQFTSTIYRCTCFGQHSGWLPLAGRDQLHGSTRPRRAADDYDRMCMPDGKVATKYFACGNINQHRPDRTRMTAHIPWLLQARQWKCHRHHCYYFSFYLHWHTCRVLKNSSTVSCRNLACRVVHSYQAHEQSQDAKWPTLQNTTRS